MITIKTTWKRTDEVDTNLSIFEGDTWAETEKKEADFFDNINDFEVVERRIIHKRGDLE